jgi:CyaY protein
MTDAEYLGLAEGVLRRVEAAIDDIVQASDVDIDVSRAGKMVELGFANKSKIVLNLQPPLHEIWLAAKSGGYHFKFDGHVWRTTKEGEEFYALLSRCLTEHALTPLQIQA